MAVECARLAYTLYYNFVSVYLLKILSNNLNELILHAPIMDVLAEIMVATRLLQFTGAKEGVAQF